MSKYKSKEITKVPKTKTSTFFLTLNSNIRNDNKDYEAFNSKFRSTVRSMFNGDNLEYFIKILEKDDGYDKISSVDSQHVVAIGSKNKNLHMHAVIRIEHNTKVHMDKDKILVFFRKNTGVNDQYLNIRYARDAGENLRKYLLKNLDEE